MKTANIKIVTIIAEPVLAATLISLAQELGASGYTSTDVRGEGSGEKNSGEVPDMKVKIEILAENGLANKIMAQIAADYFENYSLVIYTNDVHVFRAEKFSDQI